MRIDDEVQESVVFLCIDPKGGNGKADKRTPVGTAVLIRIREGDFYFGYVVTALHLLIEGRPYGKIYVRFNKKDGGYEDIPSNPDDWLTHDETDLAAIRMGGHPEYNYRFIYFEHLATDSLIAEHGVGLGDEVFFMGLFSQHPGATQAQPIARVGNISLMPNEKIPLRIGEGSTPKPLDAYLVEARSWGGQSGSPAFVYFPPYRIPGGFRVAGQTSMERYLLLGIVHGHFSKRQELKLLGSISNEGGGNVKMNLGMAIVIPAQKIVDLLMREDFVAERDKIVKKTKEEDYSIVADSAIDEGEESEFTRKDFEDALKKASGPPKKKSKRSPKKKGNA